MNVAILYILIQRRKGLREEERKEKEKQKQKA